MAISRDVKAIDLVKFGEQFFDWQGVVNGNYFDAGLF
jgi:hypothetical protein